MVFGASWAPLGASLGPLGCLLGGLWGLLGASWGLLGTSWATLGGLWEPLGQSLGPLWDSLWNLWRHWGGVFGLLGAIWVPKCAQKGSPSESNECKFASKTHCFVNRVSSAFWNGLLKRFRLTRASAGVPDRMNYKGFRRFFASRLSSNESAHPSNGA